MGHEQVPRGQTEGDHLAAPHVAKQKSCWSTLPSCTSSPNSGTVTVTRKEVFNKSLPAKYPPLPKGMGAITFAGFFFSILNNPRIPHKFH